MQRYLLPHNAAWHQAVQQGEYPPPFLDDLKILAREEGLRNLFLPGLGNLDHAPLAETMGKLHWAAEVVNCSAPDTGNMELLHRFATPAQRTQWLTPLLHGTVRSAFAMSEPDVASLDPTNLQTTVRREGDDLVLNGRKWFITGVAHPHCRLLIVMACNAPDDSAAPEGHGEIVFRQVRGPADHLLGGWGDSFAMAQARLGPCRVHHRMRTIGQCELALALATERALERRTFGKVLADCANVQTPLAQFWTWGRVLHLLDGPDEVHLRSVARRGASWSGRANVWARRPPTSRRPSRCARHHT